MEKSEDDPLHTPPEFRKVMLFNGPPRSGKSLAADAVRSFVQINRAWMYPRVMDFAEPLKKAAHSLFCVFHPWDYYDSKEAAHLKSLASGDFLGLSPREAYIALSEEFLKPKFGNEVMGFLMRKKMIQERSTQFFSIANSGFVDELRPIVDLVGQRNIHIVEIHAAGKTFEGDSRSYIGDACREKWPYIKVTKLPNIIGNKDDKDFFILMCHGLVKKFLKIAEDGD